MLDLPDEKMIHALNWYVLHTKPKQEDRAESNLRAWGIETFYPRIKEEYSGQYIGHSVFRVKPLFPQYIFARFDAGELLHKVGFTRGIHSVVSFGGWPTPVDPEIISILRARIAGDGFIRIREQIEPGDRVVITKGPLGSLTGIFERKMRGTERAAILLTAVKYQSHAIIHMDALKKVS